MKVTRWKTAKLVGLLGLALASGCAGPRTTQPMGSLTAQQLMNVGQPPQSSSWRDRLPFVGPSKGPNTTAATAPPREEGPVDLPAKPGQKKTDMMALARLNERRGQTDIAKKMYERELEANPRNATAHHRLAVIAAQEERWDASNEHFRIARELAPNNADLLSDLGYALYLQHRLSEAESCLKTAVQIDPRNAAAQNNLGIVLGVQGRFEESLAVFKRTGTAAEAYNNLAYVHAQLGDIDQALANLHQALSLDSNLRTAAVAMMQLNEIQQRLEKMHQSEQAIAQREAGPVATPQSPSRGNPDAEALATVVERQTIKQRPAPQPESEQVAVQAAPATPPAAPPPAAPRLPSPPMPESRVPAESAPTAPAVAAAESSRQESPQGREAAASPAVAQADAGQQSPPANEIRPSRASDLIESVVDSGRRPAARQQMTKLPPIVSPQALASEQSAPASAEGSPAAQVVTPPAPPTVAAVPLPITNPLASRNGASSRRSTAAAAESRREPAQGQQAIGSGALHTPATSPAPIASPIAAAPTEPAKVLPASANLANKAAGATSSRRRTARPDVSANSAPVVSPSERMQNIRQAERQQAETARQQAQNQVIVKAISRAKPKPTADSPATPTEAGLPAQPWAGQPGAANFLPGDAALGAGALAAALTPQYDPSTAGQGIPTRFPGVPVPRSEDLMPADALIMQAPTSHLHPAAQFTWMASSQPLQHLTEQPGLETAHFFNRAAPSGAAGTDKLANDKPAMPNLGEQNQRYAAPLPMRY